MLGVAQLLLAVPAVALGGHAARDLGLADLALAVGVLAAAWHPWRVAGMLPVVCCLAAGLTVVAVLDVAAGRATVAGESVHLLALLIAVSTRVHQVVVGAECVDVVHEPGERPSVVVP